MKKKKKRAATKKELGKKSQLVKSGKQSLLPSFEKRSPLKFNLLALLAIIVAGYLAYSNSLNGEMIFDDRNIVEQNEKLQDLDNFKHIKNWINPNQRQFAMLTFAINYNLHGINVFGYHLLNLIIHLIYGCFVYFFAKLILSITIFDNFPQRKHTALIAFFIALVCILHPIQTQAVSYTVQRMTSMATMFYIMSLYFYGKGRVLYVNEGLNKSVFLLYLFSLFSGILGLLSKQIMITIPLAILLFELFFIRNKEGFIFKKYLIVSFSLISILFLFIILGGFLPKETETITRSDYLYTQFRVIVKYIQLLVFPINQALDYDFAISRSFFEWKVIVSSFIILSLIISAFLLYKKKHLISFGIFWFFITLSVESSIIPIRDVIFEHRLYLPMFGFSLVIVSLIWDLFVKKWYYAVIVFFIVLNITYASATYERNKAWDSRISVWLDNTLTKPHNARAHNNLGSAYIAILNLEKAEKECEEAVRLKPDYTEALINLGFLKIDLTKYKDAILVFSKLISLDSSNYKPYYGRAIAYSNLHEYEKSLSNYEKAISNCKSIDKVDVYEKSGLLKLSLDKYQDAISDFDASIKLNPNYAEAYNNKGAVYMEMQDYNQAIIEFTKALEVRPEFFEAYNNRGNAYLNKNLYQEAISDYQKAIEFSPNEIAILKNIAFIKYNNKDYKGAIEIYSRILAIAPQSADILNDRGISYYLIEEYESAYTDMLQARRMGIITNPEIFKQLEQYHVAKENEKTSN